MRGHRGDGPALGTWALGGCGLHLAPNSSRADTAAWCRQLQQLQHTRHCQRRQRGSRFLRLGCSKPLGCSVPCAAALMAALHAAGPGLGSGSGATIGAPMASPIEHRHRCTEQIHKSPTSVVILCLRRGHIPQAVTRFSWSPSPFTLTAPRIRTPQLCSILMYTACTAPRTE